MGIACGSPGPGPAPPRQEEVRVPSSSRSATAGCSCRRSRSTEARRSSWRRTCRFDTSFRPQGPGLRRRPRLELRPVRLARARARLRHQRLRRDPPGPWEWDVKRLVASLAIAGRNNGFSAQERRGRARSPPLPRTEPRCMSSPRCATSRSGTRIARCEQGLPRLQAMLDKKAAQGRREDGREGPARRTACRPSTSSRRSSMEQRKIISDPPLIVTMRRARRGENEADGLPRGHARPPADVPRDAPRAIVDTCSRGSASSTSRARSSASGSVGTRAFIILLLGRDTEDPLFLQAKQAGRLGPRAVRRARAGSRTPVSASSRASG